MRGFRICRICICIMAIVVFVLPFRSLAQQVVRVGWYAAPGLQDGTDSGHLSGFNYEYLIRIAQYTDWQYEFVFGDFGTLEKELMAGKVDIMGDVAKTEARLSMYNYSAYPSCYSHTLLLCRPDDDHFAYDGYDEFNGMTVGNTGSAFRKSMLDRVALQHQLQVVYKDYSTDEAMLEALDRGDVDTALISDAIQHKKYKILHEWEPAAQYFIVNKERTDILEQLNGAMGSLQSADRAIQSHLFDKYFGGDNNEFSIALTREEMDFVAAAPVLTVLLAENQKPLSYVEDGQAKGFIPDYLALISQKTGLKFQYVWCPTYADVIERFQSGEGDICGQLHDDFTKAAQNGSKKVQPYVTVPYGFIYDPEVTGIIRTIAVEKGDSQLSARMEAMGFTPVAFATPQACLDAVNDKKVDAAAMASNIFEQLAYHAPYIHLVYKTQVGLDEKLCLGVTAQGSPELFRILSKAAGFVSPDTITQFMLRNNYVQPQYTWEDWLYLNRTPIFSGTIIVIVALFFLLWYRRQIRYNRALQQAAEAKKSFFANISHDMRTPLNGVIGYTELAREASSLAVVKNYLDKLHVSGQLLLELINDTLDFSKLESKHITLLHEPVRLGAICQNVETIIRPLAEHKGVVFRIVRPSPYEGYVDSDSLRLQQIFVNLLSNAVKFTNAGGLVENSISEEVRGQSVHVTVIVRDTGIGMSEAFLPKIFEAYSQEEGRSGAPGGGTGLGMAIVKEIVDLFHGTISVDSAIGKGTAFTVQLTFPMSKGPAQAPVQDGAELSLLEHKRVLLFEDNPLNAEIAQLFLEKKGMAVTIAVNGKEGVELFNRSAPAAYDCILMDKRMPVMDGVEAAKAIRALDRSDAKTIPILAMTGDVDDASIAECMAAGMNGHIGKPIQAAELFRTLARMLQDRP